MIQKERVQHLNSKPIKNRRYILYWMQASQRTVYNHALQYAIIRANELNKPLIVYFGIVKNFPEANLRHYHFMAQGLQEVQQSLRDLGIQMVVRLSSPESGAVELSLEADLVVVDRGYLKIQRKWRRLAAERMDCSLIQVESDVIVPVELASPKEEYAASTFRPKITRILNRFLVPPPDIKANNESLKMPFDSIHIEDIIGNNVSLNIDRSVKPVSGFKGGTASAESLLDHFIEQKLVRYDELRNDPSLDYLSNMSPYLHFGQISALYIALQIMDMRSTGGEAYLEELIIRRELSINFVYYNDNYDSFDCLPDWAKKTLSEHLIDKRTHIYSPGALEAADTHDPYWNAAQKQMVMTGKMHGYMRMYWGKKILEWCSTPAEAFDLAIHLNNKYELDGRDPNGFTGVAWCFGKHDRAWFEREIFGKVRYMNANGLRRKFDIDTYVDRINHL